MAPACSGRRVLSLPDALPAGRPDPRYLCSLRSGPDPSAARCQTVVSELTVGPEEGRRMRSAFPDDLRKGGKAN